MAPTKKATVPGIGAFMRITDGSFAMPPVPAAPASPRGGGAAVVSETPAGAPFRDVNVVGPIHPLSPQLKAVPEVASRQEMAAAARLAPPRTGRFATSSSQQQGAMSPSSQKFRVMPRNGTVSEYGQIDPQQEKIWEDSTVTSMWDGDLEERVGLRAPGRHTRQSSIESVEYRPHPQRPAQLHRVHQIQPTQHVQPKQDDNMRFLIGGDGMMKMVDPPVAPHRPVATSLGVGLLHEQPHNLKPNREERQGYDSPPSKSALRRTKLPHRDVREPQRSSFQERLGSYPPEANSVGMSPERSSDAGEELEVHRRTDKDRRRQHFDLEYKRTTVFENLSPVEEPTATFDNTAAAVGVLSSDLTAEEEEFKGSLQGSPTITRLPLAIENVRVHETSLGRTNSRRPERTSKKRPRDGGKLDYDDAELHQMSFADLCKEDFDFDPQAAAAVQQKANPVVTTMEEKLQHHRNEDNDTQEDFFTRISVREWDEAGDWFLDQFADVVQRIKDARKNKRAIVTRYEEEIAAREEAVRGKVEGIERTLEELKQEGQNMMQGKPDPGEPPE